ncbi:MAG: class I SAM-dependent RNA methyltransferase [Verrucomicrobiota bacterium]
MTLEVGFRARVSVVDLAFGGEGVARLDQFVIFIPFVIPGEEVEVEIVEAKKRFARGRLIQILRASPDRVTPPCPYFGECGGCQYQHLVYGAQLIAKHKQVADVLQRLGGVDPSILQPVVPCPSPYGYRNRIMVRSQWDKFKQGLNIGFIRHDNRLVVDIQRCLIAEPDLNDQFQQVRAHPPPKGGIKVVLRVAPEGWEVPPDSFFQNNFHLLPKLVDVARECIQSGGARYLIDAYCGVGFFSLELADLVESFVGIEFDHRAVRAAVVNAARRNKANGEFVSGRSEDLISQMLGRYPASQTGVILDPPRIGCPADMLQLLQQVRPRQIVYVSCHPATLARDLAVLCSEGIYRVERVVPLDMFPQTQHVECVADLRLAAG